MSYLNGALREMKEVKNLTRSTTESMCYVGGGGQKFSK